MTTFKEWNTKLLSLSPEEFEDLCYEIIASLGFENLDWRMGGGDKGRDITAEKFERKAGIETIVEKWHFQCKRYSSGISVSDISSSIEWAMADKADYLVIISNSHLTTACKEFVGKKNRERKTKIFWWTDKKFQRQLFRFPQIVASFFPDEKIPEAHKVNQLQKAFEVTLPVSPKLAEEIREKIEEVATLPMGTKIERITGILKEKIIDSEEIDVNLKALFCQQFSVFLYNTRNFREALRVIDKGLSISPKSTNLLRTKGFFLTAKKSDVKAEICYDKLLRINPNDKLAWNNLGHIRVRHNKHESAMRCFEKAISLDPDYILARDNKGGLLKTQYKFEGALETYEETLKRFPRSKTTLEKKAELLRVDKDYKNAILVVEKCLEIDPYFAVGQNTKGVILQHNGKHYDSREKFEKYNKLALEVFEKVIELDPDYVLGHANKVVCLNNLGQLEDALKYSDELLEKFPEEEMPWLKKAIVLKKMGKVDEAHDCVKKSLEIYPNFKEALLEEALFYADAGKHRKALKIIIRLLKTFKRDEDIWSFKGMVSEANGDKKEAEHCREMVEKYNISVKSLIE